MIMYYQTRINYDCRAKAIVEQVSEADRIIHKPSHCFFVILPTAFTSRCNTVPNGRCSHFCFPAPSFSRVCGCPYGMKLQDNQRDCIKDDSVIPPDNICGDHAFECDEGRCRPNSYRCDGIVDCVDKTDEANCTDTGERVKKNRLSRNGRKMIDQTLLIHQPSSFVCSRSDLLSTSVHLQQ